MKTNNLLHLLPCLFFIIACNSKSDSSYALNENFDSNEIGWPEESTSSHSTEIRNGSYFVHSKTNDTTKKQTSVSPQRITFLFNLPKHYEITTSIKPIQGNAEMEYGITLISASLTYRFTLTDSGDVYVTEYDYNTEVEDTLINGNYRKSDEIAPSGVKFTFNVTDRNLQFLLDEKTIGSCKLKTKQWIDILLFTTVKSEIAIDYLKIKRL